MIYLDNAATSFPKPTGMLRVMYECMRDYCGNPGRSGHSMSMKTGEEVYKARNGLAELFHIKDSSQVIFTCNTTESLNLGIKGVLEYGDHVITTSMEHNSVLRPLKALEQMGIETTVIKCAADGALNMETLMKEICPNTKLIICTHASNVTGTIMPIKEIGSLARQYGILFMVDAAQSAGALPIDVEEMNIDLLAAPGHKGLLGPMGTGILYVRDSVAVWPLKEGGTGTRSKELDQPNEFPEGYEAGTVNAPGIIGLGYSAGYVAKLGIDHIRAHEEELISVLDQALRNMSGVTVYGPVNCKEKTGVTVFNLKNTGCEETCDILSQYYGIASRGGFHCAALAHKTIGTHDTGAVRLSVSPFSTKRDINLAIQAIYQMQKV